MDGRRRQAQLEVYEVTNAYGSICASCGNCCREATDRFSVMDAAVRADTDHPAPSFGTTLLSPVWELWNTLRHTAIRLASLGRPKVAMDKCNVCAHLTPTGCELALEDRPMICATWFCPRLMAAMSPTDLLQISKPMAVIEDIQREAVKDLRGRGD
jgi:Fe-S-cluster containining protein